MYPRRPHRNSHHGCRECKQRRVKCDETQPQCLRCKSKGRKCTYTHLLSQYDPFSPQQQKQRQKQPQRQPLRHATATPSLSLPQQQSLVCRANRIPTPSINNSSLSFKMAAMLDEKGDEIFHHYMYVVSTIDLEHVASEQLWRWEKVVRALAPSHEFLYYAVLTLASLHRYMAYQRCANDNACLDNSTNVAAAGAAAAARQQCDRFVALASAYQTHALAGFVPAVARMKQKGGRSGGGGGGGGSGVNSAIDAVLVCSSMILSSSFVFPPSPGQGILDQVRQVLQLFYGTFALYDQVWEEDGMPAEGPLPAPPPSIDTAGSVIGTWVRTRMLEGELLGAGAPAPAAEASLDRLADAVLLRAGTELGTVGGMFEDGAAASADILGTFLAPVNSLRVLFRRLAARPALHTIALRWPSVLTHSFLVSLEKGDPLALIVLAHWARCLAGFRHLWWISNWGVRVAQAVARELGCGDLLVEDPGVEGGSGVEAEGAGMMMEGCEGSGAGRKRGVESGAEANAWRACLEWPVRGLGDPVAVCWHRFDHGWST